MAGRTGWIGDDGHGYYTAPDTQRTYRWIDRQDVRPSVYRFWADCVTCGARRELLQGNVGKLCTGCGLVAAHPDRRGAAAYQDLGPADFTDYAAFKSVESTYQPLHGLNRPCNGNCTSGKRVCNCRCLGRCHGMGHCLGGHE